MRIHLIAVGTRMPGWVEEGFQEYARRMPKECSLHMIEIPLSKRRKSSSPEQARAEEGRLMLAAIPADCHVIALDVQGKAWSTETLADKLRDWLSSGRNVALLVGGPDGLHSSCLNAATACWSLSALTFPHSLVRIVLAEQLYRAWTVTTGHPYHRS